MLLEPVDSIAIYKHYWWFWKWVGISPKGNFRGSQKYLCGFYDLLVNIFVTIGYPLHLSMGLLVAETQADVFKNMAINITCLACSFKHYCYRYKLNDIRRFQTLLAQLDKRAVAAEERIYFRQHTKVAAQRISNLFIAIYALSNLAASILVLFGAERHLMYPAWFPFDWTVNIGYFLIALLYQFVGVTGQIVIDLANDIYAPMSMCIMAGHVRLLKMRVARIGHDSEKSALQNHEELIACIGDHKQLISMYHILESTFSVAQLAQFASSGIIIVSVLIYLLFYADNALAYVYYTVYLSAMLLEIFPGCYYGSVLQIEFETLPYAIFNINWLDQGRAFRSNAIIFSELALRKITPLAGGIISVHLDAFFATIKMTYSLFAVVMRVKS